MGPERNFTPVFISWMGKSSAHEMGRCVSMPKLWAKHCLVGLRHHAGGPTWGHHRLAHAVGAHDRSNEQIQQLQMSIYTIYKASRMQRKSSQIISLYNQGSQGQSNKERHAPMGKPFTKTIFFTHLGPNGCQKGIRRVTLLRIACLGCPEARPRAQILIFWCLSDRL